MHEKLRYYYRVWKQTVIENQKIAAAARLATIQRVFWTALTMALGSLTIAYFFANSQSLTEIEALWRIKIVQVHLITTGCSVLLWLFAWFLKDGGKHRLLEIVFQYIVVAFVLTVGVVITIIDHLVMSNIAPALLTLTIVGTFYYLRPSRSLLAFFGAFSLAHFAMLKRTNIAPSTLDSILANLLVASALGFSLSVLTWRNFRIKQIQKIKILEQQEVLQKMAYQDPLTQLPNRRLLDELLKKEVPLVRRGQIKSSLLIFDLDNFKAVNDTYGHPIGDQVLQELAVLLGGTMRASDTFVRLGGEEFVILASGATLEEAVALGERLRRIIAEHRFLGEEYQIRLTASFGVAPILGTEEPGICYQLADQALYKAKELGKNRVEFIMERREKQGEGQ